MLGWAGAILIAEAVPCNRACSAPAEAHNRAQRFSQYACDAKILQNAAAGTALGAADAGTEIREVNPPQG